LRWHDDDWHYRSMCAEVHRMRTVEDCDANPYFSISAELPSNPSRQFPRRF
jgi:hypothetical protein